jgi:hypothetical protein
MSILDRLPVPFRSHRPAAADRPAPPVYQNPAIPADRLNVSPFDEIGASGTMYVSGIRAREEYNPKLDGDALLRVVDQMWRSDGQVHALINVLMLPILQARWRVEPGSDDAQDVAIAQMVQDNLFGGMQQTWMEHLEFVLLQYFRDGFAVEEKVFGYADGGATVHYQSRDADGRLVTLSHQAPASAARRVVLLKLAPRKSSTIYRWYPNEHGDLDRIQQRVWRNNPDGVGGMYVFPVLPADKVVVYSHQREGQNFQGVSVLRAAYKHWYYKDQLYRIDAIAAERGAVGLPVWGEPQNVQKADRDRAAKAAASLHAYEQGYLMRPFGWEFELMMPPRFRDLSKAIDHHDLLIARSVLAQFLNLDKGGSYALSRDVSAFFLAALYANAQYICDVHNRDIVRPLVDFNWRGVRRYPKLTVSELDRRDAERWSVGLARLFMAGAVTPTPDTENAIRAQLGLPDLPPEADGAGGGWPTVDISSQGPAARPAAGETALTRAEERAQLHRILDRGEAAADAAIRALVDRQIDALVGAARAAVARGDHPAAAGVTVPEEDRLARLLARVMREHHAIGVSLVTAQAHTHRATAHLAAAAGADGGADGGDDGGDPVWARTRVAAGRTLRQKARALAAGISATLAGLYAQETSDQADAARFDPERLRARLTAGISRTLTRVVGTVVGGALALGRAAAARRTGATVATYEAQHDGATCGPCAEADGLRFRVGSAAYAAHMPPNPDCRGGDRCRCSYVYDWEPNPTDLDDDEEA